MAMITASETLAALSLDMVAVEVSHSQFDLFIFETISASLSPIFTISIIFALVSVSRVPCPNEVAASSTAKAESMEIFRISLCIALVVSPLRQPSSGGRISTLEENNGPLALFWWRLISCYGKRMVLPIQWVEREEIVNFL